MVENESLVEVFHELKNPLAVIKINLALLKDNSALGESIKYDVIENEINKMDNIIKKYLLYSSYKDDEKDYVYFSEVINSIIEENKKTYPYIEYIINETKDLSILAFEYHIFMIFSNIIKNAIEAMNEKGTIVINIFEQEGIANIEIIDSGIGMKQKPVKLLKSTRFTTKKNGSGLGTLIIKNMVNIYDGKFYLISESNGTKACVKFLI